MTTLHFVKKARKPQRKHGIRKGDGYWWWAFRQGGRSVKHVSKIKPRRSQWQTQSPFLCVLLDAEDDLREAADAFLSGGSLDDFVAAIIVAEENVREEGVLCSEKRDNLPDSLRDGAPGELLRERAEACERIADELEAARTDAESETEPTAGDYEDSDEYQEEVDAWLERVAGVIDGVDWSVS